MGKTIMIASLLHTNRFLPEPPSSSPPPPSFKPNNQLLPDGPKEKSKPRQVRLQAAFKNHSNAKSTVNDVPRPQQGKSKADTKRDFGRRSYFTPQPMGRGVEEMQQGGDMDVHIWHGQNRFSLYEALYPDEVEYIDDDDDEQEEIESHSDKEDEDVVMVDESESEAEGDDDEEWKPKAELKEGNEGQAQEGQEEKDPGRGDFLWRVSL
jgi:hypothetical protein